MKSQKRTKIVCTIGPASSSTAKLTRLIRGGMNAARLNLSHGDYKSHRAMIKNIRAVEKKLGEPIALLGDLQGPKIRVGNLSAEGLKIVKGEVIEIPVTYPNLYRDVKKGDRILIEDGIMDGFCEGGKAGFLKIKINVGGTIFSHKGLNFPDSTLKIEPLTEKDRLDAAFCVREGLHYVAMSFVTDPKDIRNLRRLLKSKAKVDQPIPMIIAKIEKHEAVRRFDEILKEVDAVMVARGDLGIEIPAEQVPLVQKEIIEKCRVIGKPVIVATQMLDSMIRNPRPTRAEVSDVANAVIDHTDAVMLSGETATGKYPVEAVETMTRIIQETEASKFDDVSPDEAVGFVKINTDAIGGAVNWLSHTAKTDAILVTTLSGKAAYLVSRFRPELPIIVATASEFVRHQLALSWSVSAVVIPKTLSVDDLISKSVKKLKKDRLVKSGEKIIILAGQPLGKKINFVEIKEI